MKSKLAFLTSAIMVFVLVLPYTGHSQFLKRLKNTVQNTAENRADDDAANETNKAIDSGANSVKNKKTNNAGSTKADTTNNSGNSAASGSSSTAPAINSYQNYDFVPGDTVLFADDFSEDQDGEFPSHWDLQKGQAVRNIVAGKPSFCLTQGNYCHVSPRMKTESYLGNTFTIEFDTYCDDDGSQGSPYLYLTYLDKDGNSQDGQIDFDKGDQGGRGDVSLEYFPHGLNADMPEALKNAYPNSWHHCAIIYKNNQLKCYVDQYRVLTVPNLDCAPRAFGFEGIGDQDHPIVITNVRLASGGNMNMIGKKFTGAKIVTHGITFDVDKSDIKPQSMGTLNMIVNVMKSNPGLRFEIDGHTDNTGDAAHNLTLSQQRADAVKTQLVKMGVADSRFTTKGFGDTKPIDTNDTPEGKANNRRVEFVKQ